MVFILYQLSGEVLSVGGIVLLPPGYVLGISVLRVYFGRRLAILVARAITNLFTMVFSDDIISSACIEEFRVVIGAMIVDLIA